MKGFRRTNLFAQPATNALGGVKIFGRVEIERTNFFATPALDALILREIYLIKAVLVKQAVNRAERTHCAAKKSVDKNAPDNHGEQDRNFQRE